MEVPEKPLFHGTLPCQDARPTDVRLTGPRPCLRTGLAEASPLGSRPQGVRTGLPGSAIGSPPGPALSQFLAQWRRTPGGPRPESRHTLTNQVSFCFCSRTLLLSDMSPACSYKLFLPLSHNRLKQTTHVGQENENNRNPQTVRSSAAF